MPSGVPRASITVPSPTLIAAFGGSENVNSSAPGVATARLTSISAPAASIAEYSSCGSSATVRSTCPAAQATSSEQSKVSSLAVGGSRRSALGHRRLEEPPRSLRRRPRSGGRGSGGGGGGNPPGVRSPPIGHHVDPTTGGANISLWIRRGPATWRSPSRVAGTGRRSSPSARCWRWSTAVEPRRRPDQLGVRWVDRQRLRRPALPLRPARTGRARSGRGRARRHDRQPWRAHSAHGSSASSVARSPPVSRRARCCGSSASRPC